MPQRLSAFQWALLAPGALLLVLLLVAPIALMTIERFHPFVGGRVGAGAGWTLRNYTELIEPASPLRQVTDAYVCGYVDAVADVATKHNTPIERPKILGCPTARASPL